MPALFAFVLSALVPPASASTAANPAVTLAPAAADSWAATYRTTKPVHSIAFMRTPDESRLQRWRLPEQFEIKQKNGTDYLQRKDGKPFREVRVLTPTSLILLPKDYIPFSRFSDGGLLIHTGRFFACAESCGEAHNEWQFTLRPPAGANVIYDGSIKSGAVSWTDSDSGRNVYVGPAAPLAGDHFTAIIDPALPATVREPLVEMFPRFMDYYAEHLGQLEERPMLFASFEQGWGSGLTSKGGTLPNQVFMHVAGTMPQSDPSFPFKTGWFFGHEAAHMFQGRAISSDPEDAWIHEGAAEAFSALATAPQSAAAAAYAAKRIADAEQSCAEGLRKVALNTAAEAKQFNLFYTCGLVIQSHLQKHLTDADPKGDGIFALWRDYRKRVETGAEAGRETYVAAVNALVGTEAAAWVRHVTSDKIEDPEKALASF